MGLGFSELVYPVSTTSVPIGDTSVALTRRGPDPVRVVFVHGLGSYMPAWVRNFDAVPMHIGVAAIDLPGFGKSSKADHPYSMAFFATVLDAVLDVVGARQPVLVGHSMGAQIAMTLALAQPHRISGLVLASPAGFEAFGPLERAWLESVVTPEFTLNARPEVIARRHRENFRVAPAEANFMLRDRLAITHGPDYEDYARAVARSVSGMLRGPVFDRLGEIEHPTLVTFGKYDALIPNPLLHPGSTERTARRGTTRLREGRLVMLSAGHFAHFEQPDAWNAAVRDFLDHLLGGSKKHET